MTFFNLPEQLSPLEHLSRSLGQGIGGGLQARNTLNLETQRTSIADKMKEAAEIRKEEWQRAVTQEGVNELQEKLKALGPDASISDKFAAIAATPVSEASKKSLYESLQFEGAKDFINKLRESEGESISQEDILEGMSLGYIPPGAGVELLRGVTGTREKEGAAKIYTPAYQEALKAGKTAREGMATVRRQRELLNSKEHWGPLTWDNLLKHLGLGGAASPEAQEFEASVLGYLTGEKSRFGVRLSDADLALIKNKMTDISRTKEGNEALLNLRESEYQFHILESQAQQNVLKRNKGFTYDFQDQVDKELESLLAGQPEIQKLYTNSAETLKRLAGEENKPTDQEEFNILPSASENKGEYFKDTKTGQVYLSNGISWKKV